MKAKLVIEGKEFPIEINDPELQKLLAPPKKTGYERVENDAEMYYQHADGYSSVGFDHRNATADKYYDAANYYSDKHVAENNARADKLMRQLRRFAAFQRDKNIDWKDTEKPKYYIRYDYDSNELSIGLIYVLRDAFNIYFHSESCAKAAMDLFHDELIWYFTQYKDSM